LQHLLAGHGLLVGPFVGQLALLQLGKLKLHPVLVLAFAQALLLALVLALEALALAAAIGLVGKLAAQVLHPQR
jgi:hypothetical protein